MSATERVKRHFGERVRRLREGRGWQLDDLGHRLGKSRSSVSRIENGKQNLKMVDIARIAEVLEVDVQELFGGQSCLLVQDDASPDVARDAWVQLGYQLGYLSTNDPAFPAAIQGHPAPFPPGRRASRFSPRAASTSPYVRAASSCAYATV